MSFKFKCFFGSVSSSFRQSQDNTGSVGRKEARDSVPIIKNVN